MHAQTYIRGTVLSLAAWLEAAEGVTLGCRLFFVAVFSAVTDVFRDLSLLALRNCRRCRCLQYARIDRDTIITPHSTPMATATMLAELECSRSVHKK